MSEKEQDTKTALDTPTPERETHEDNQLSPYQLNAKENNIQENAAKDPDLASTDTEVGSLTLGCFGCLGSFIFLLFIFIMLKLMESLILAALGIILLFALTRRTKYKGLFLGALIPYLFFLLIVGTCTGYH